MYTTGFESLDQKVQKESEISSAKWRRSGRDRRLDNDDEFFEEKRGFTGRRIDWFGIISSIIFPRHSKIK